MFRHRIRFHHLAVAAIAVSVGCQKPTSAPTHTPQPAAVATSPAPAAPAPTTCKDWSDLDVDSLPKLPHTPYTATLEQAWQTVLTKHYDPTLGCTDWPQIRLTYGERLTKATDTATAYTLLNSMLGELGQSHLRIMPPGAKFRGEPREGLKVGNGKIPLRLRLFGDEVIIVDNAADGHKSGLPAGATIIAVEGNEVAPVVTSAKAHYKREVQVALSASRAVEAWLKCPPKTKRKITYRPYGSTKTRTKAVRCYEDHNRTVKMGHLNAPISSAYRMIKGPNGAKVGYITFNIWLLPLMKDIREGMAALEEQGMQSLIIDLRGNPGGVGTMVVPLGRLLLDEKTSLGVMNMRTAKQEFNVVPQGEAFMGPLVLLVDEGTGSTSEIFAQAFQDLKRARVFGASASQGAALPSLIEELAGGAILQYVVADYQSPSGTSVEGRGVQPDVTVPENITDFVNGSDPVLDAAVKALGTHPSPASDSASEPAGAQG